MFVFVISKKTWRHHACKCEALIKAMDIFEAAGMRINLEEKECPSIDRNTHHSPSISCHLCLSRRNCVLLGTPGLQEACGSKAVGQPWRGLDDWRSGSTDAWCHDSWLTSRRFEASEVASMCIHSFGDWLLSTCCFCLFFVHLCPFLVQEEDDWALFVAAATGVVHGHSCAKCAGGATVVVSSSRMAFSILALKKLPLFVFSAATTTGGISRWNCKDHGRWRHRHHTAGSEGPQDCLSKVNGWL